MSMTTDRPKRGRLRLAVLAIAAIEVALLGALVLLFLDQAGSSDPLSRAIAGAVATVLAAPLAILAVPALVLGIMGRWLPLALTLAFLVMPGHGGDLSVHVDRSRGAAARLQSRRRKFCADQLLARRLTIPSYHWIPSIR